MVGSEPPLIFPLPTFFRKSLSRSFPLSWSSILLNYASPQIIFVTRIADSRPQSSVLIIERYLPTRTLNFLALEAIRPQVYCAFAARVYGTETETSDFFQLPRSHFPSRHNVWMCVLSAEFNCKHIIITLSKISIGPRFLEQLSTRRGICFRLHHYTNCPYCDESCVRWMSDECLWKEK